MGDIQVEPWITIANGYDQILQDIPNFTSLPESEHYGYGRWPPENKSIQKRFIAGDQRHRYITKEIKCAEAKELFQEILAGKHDPSHQSNIDYSNLMQSLDFVHDIGDVDMVDGSSSGASADESLSSSSPSSEIRPQFLSLVPPIPFFFNTSSNDFGLTLHMYKLYNNLFLNFNICELKPYGNYILEVDVRGIIRASVKKCSSFEKNVFKPYLSASINTEKHIVCSTMKPTTSSEDGTTCNICYDNIKDLVFLPCAHGNMCTICFINMIAESMDRCGDFYQSCPFCRAPVNKCMRVIL
jgi:hypothetical protein